MEIIWFCFLRQSLLWAQFISLQIHPFALSCVLSGEVEVPSPWFLKAPLISACHSRSWALVQSLAHTPWCGPLKLHHPVLISWFMEVLTFPATSWKGKLWMVREKDGKELDEKLFLSLPTNCPQILHDYSLLFLQRLSMEPSNPLCLINCDKLNSMSLAFSPSFFCLMQIHPRTVFSRVSVFAWVLKI